MTTSDQVVVRLEIPNWELQFLFFRMHADLSGTAVARSKLRSNGALRTPSVWSPVALLRPEAAGRRRHSREAGSGDRRVVTPRQWAARDSNRNTRVKSPLLCQLS